MVLLFSDHLRYMKNLNIGFFHISSFWHIRKLNVCGEKLFFYVICMKVFWISGTGKTPKWKRMRFELLISCKKIRWCYICEQLVTHMMVFWLIWFVWRVIQEKKIKKSMWRKTIFLCDMNEGFLYFWHRLASQMKTYEVWVAYIL